MSYVLDYSNFGKNWNTTEFSSFDGRASCMSLTGQYQSILGVNQLSYSHNFGDSWQTISLPITLPSDTATFNCIAMSSDGKYQTVVYSGGIRYSNDYGQSWLSASAPVNNYTGVSITSSGQYQISSYNGGICYSNDYGQSWTASTSSFVYNYNGISMSSDGKYQTVATYGRICYSKDYGETWLFGSIPYNFYRNVAMSSNGQYQTTGGSSSIGIYYSHNFGANWYKASLDIPISGQSYGFAVSYTGQYQCIGLSKEIKISNDYGKTWKTKTLSSYSIYSVSISYPEQYILVVTSKTEIMTSFIDYLYIPLQPPVVINENHSKLNPYNILKYCTASECQKAETQKNLKKFNTATNSTQQSKAMRYAQYIRQNSANSITNNNTSS